jgi:hypothetical protein
MDAIAENPTERQKARPNLNAVLILKGYPPNSSSERVEGPSAAWVEREG